MSHNEEFNQSYNRSMQKYHAYTNLLNERINTWQSCLKLQESLNQWLLEAKRHLEKNNFETEESIRAEEKFFEVSTH